MRIAELKAILARSLDGLVHPSIAPGTLLATRHRSFIGSHLLGGIMALALVPGMLAVSSAAGWFAATALAALGAQVLVALYVSRTASCAGGYLASSAVLSVLIGWIAVWTGGLSAFALVWFAVVPVEAILSGSRRVVVAAAGIALASLAVVALVTIAGWLPPPLALPLGPDAFGLLAVAAAIGYGALIAVQIAALQRESESAIRAEEARYRLLADTMTDIVTCHGANGDVLFASPAARRVLGTEPEALFGDGLFRRVHVADRPAFLQALSRAAHESSTRVEFRLRAEDEAAERYIWAEALMERRGAAGADEATLVVAVTRDIARRKAQEGEVALARASAEEASEAKTRFLANVSHELRTPLNAIIGFSDLLSQELVGSFEQEQHREYVQLIHKSGEHLLQVVNDILDISKLESGTFDVTPEPFSLPPVMETCIQMMMPQANAGGVRLVAEIDPGLPELVADRRACRQILINLLSNAIKFTERGGTVVCSARRQGASLLLSVRDTGIGISDHDLPRLGTPFVQAESGYDRRHEGTGLGLSMVKGLAALHSGTMTIESRLGEGTQVTVRLPINCEKDRLRPQAGAAATPVALPRRAVGA